MKFLNHGEDISLSFGGEQFLIAKWLGSYLPVLLKILDITSGNVLELGTGIYSTPFLHWYCLAKNRHLTSVEESSNYVDMAKQYVSEFHDIYKVDSYPNFELEKEWDVVLLDHSPYHARNQELKRIAPFAKYIVVHDSHPGDDTGIKYRFDYMKTEPFTSVFSNTIDVSNLFT